jgi:hypothetical protein
MVTAILALGTMLVQWMELRRSRELAAKQNELIALKDEMLRIELSEKDVRIADANQASGNAKLEAAQAGKAAADAHERASVAIERAARFEKEAEDLRRKNLEVQKSLTPRWLAWNDTVFSRLGRFKGTIWDLQVPAGDPEAKDFGDLIGTTVQKANWVFGNGSTVHGERFVEGVIIHVAPLSAHQSAAAELVSYILANGAHAVLKEDNSVSQDRVLIRVGSKPRLPLFLPSVKGDDHAQLQESESQKQQEMEARRREWLLPPWNR